MKLIVMREVGGFEDLFIKFDTLEEEVTYYVGVEYMEDPDTSSYGEGIISGLLTGGCGEPLSDDDICYYFSPDEKTPEIGEEWELDGTKYIRIK